MGLDAVVKEIEDEGEGKETRERIRGICSSPRG